MSKTCASTTTPSEPPPLPHLLPPAELEAPTIDVLIDELLAVGDWSEFLFRLDVAGMLDAAAREGSQEDRRRRQLKVMLGETGSVRATLYSPAVFEPAAGGLLVRVTSTGRLLGERLFASAYPGRVLDVELPTARPAVMMRYDTVALVAERFAARTLPLLREQDQRALAGLGVGTIEPDSAAARLALQVLSRVTVTRLRAARPVRVRGGGRLSPGLSFSLLRSTGGFDPFSLTLLRTVSGMALSLSELALMVDETGGLVYGTIPEVAADLQDLDRDRILALDAASERTLIGLLGEAGYVRIDARDVIASADGLRVRDMALGLREYPDFPLLLEGAVERLAELDDQGKDELLDALLTGLKQRMLGEADEPGVDARELEEHRRQAVRHLQWYVCRELVRSGVEPLERRGLYDLPLFVDLDGEVWALRQVAAALRSPEGLLVHYGHAFGSAELGYLCAAARAGRKPPEGRPNSIAVSCFGYRLLAPLGRVRLAFDFDLDDLEAARNPMSAGVAFLVEDQFAFQGGSSVLGVPAVRTSEYRIELRVQGRGPVAALDEVAYRYGVVGSIELPDARLDEDEPEQLVAMIDQRATALLERLIAKLPELAEDPRRHDAALGVLLSYAGEQLRLVLEPIGLLVEVATPLASRILGLPLFDVGATTLISGQRLIDRFRREFQRQLHDGTSSFTPIDWSKVLAESTPKLVHEWLDAHLQPAAVIMPASHSARPGTAPAPTRGADERSPWSSSQPIDATTLGWNLEHWLAQLRPDVHEGEPTRVWIIPNELPRRALLEGGDCRMDLWQDHPLVARALATPTAEHLAWLLLAIYAHINASSGLVSNADEARFHVIVGEALREGRLQVLVPRLTDLSGPVC